MLCVAQKSLNSALKHIENYGDTDVFPIPFEYAAIRAGWKASVRPYLVRRDLHDWQVRPMRPCLSPKHRFGFRVSMQLDPLDAVLYTALVYEVGGDLEESRVPALKQVVYSYRFKPDNSGRMYDPRWGYDGFRRRSQQLADSGDYSHVVVADIADFFPRIYSHRLENALREATKQSDHVTAIDKFIDQWNFSVSYGIPIGTAASRLLSEITIHDVDEALLSEGQNFCRFSDDYRIFCTDERAAYEVLSFLANALFENHGLTLQQHKTEILPADAFRARYLGGEHVAERKSLAERFEDILATIGITDPYEPINYLICRPSYRLAWTGLTCSVSLTSRLMGHPKLTWG